MSVIDCAVIFAALLALCAFSMAVMTPIPKLVDYAIRHDWPLWLEISILFVYLSAIGTVVMCFAIWMVRP